jgi:hypothetical protein
MERWHEIAEENKLHLTNTSQFKPEDVHPADMADDYEARRAKEEAEAAKGRRLRRRLAAAAAEQEAGWGGRAVAAVQGAWRWLVG